MVGGWDTHDPGNTALKQLILTVSELVISALCILQPCSWRSKYFGKISLLWSVKKYRPIIFYNETFPNWLAGSEAHS